MNLNARLEVEFDGEPGVDAGSLTREYFSMLMGHVNGEMGGHHQCHPFLKEKRATSFQCTV